MPEPAPQRFRARLDSAGGGGAAVTVPPDAAAALGARKRPPVTVTIAGHVEWIGEAKRPETRARRAAEMVELVRRGRSAP